MCTCRWASAAACSMHRLLPTCACARVHAGGSQLQHGLGLPAHLHRRQRRDPRERRAQGGAGRSAPCPPPPSPLCGCRPVGLCRSVLTDISLCVRACSIFCLLRMSCSELVCARVCVRRSAAHLQPVVYNSKQTPAHTCACVCAAQRCPSTAPPTSPRRRRARTRTSAATAASPPSEHAPA